MSPVPNILSTAGQYLKRELLVICLIKLPTVSCYDVVLLSYFTAAALPYRLQAQAPIAIHDSLGQQIFPLRLQADRPAASALILGLADADTLYNDQFLVSPPALSAASPESLFIKNLKNTC